MRIYKNLPEALNEIKRDLAEMGIVVHPMTWQDQVVAGNKEFDTLELQNYIYTVSNPNSLDIENDVTQPWARTEFGERVSKRFPPVNPGEAWKLRREVWEPFLHGDKFAYTYNERLQAVDQLEHVINRLAKDPDTRQAFISVWNPVLDVPLMGGHGRIPCSLGYYFQIRQGQLNMTYLQRSADFITHFANDVYLAVNLQEHVLWILERVDVDVHMGSFTHWVGSLHMFRKDAEGVF